MKSQAFSGIDIRPVGLFKDDKCRIPVPGYVEMRFTGRVKVDEEASGVGVDYECPICGFKNLSHWNESLGLHFEGDSRDWPDAFEMAQRLTMHVFVKPRFAQFMVDLKVRPLTLQRFEDLRLSGCE